MGQVYTEDIRIGPDAVMKIIVPTAGSVPDQRKAGKRCRRKVLCADAS